MNDSDRQELTRATFSALKWSYGSTAVKTISQMVIGIVLARLLGPEPFGLVAVAWIIIELGSLIADFGFGAALVQYKTLSEKEIRCAFTIQVLTGFGLTLIVVGLAGPIAQAFKQEQLVLVLRMLSLIFIIQAFKQTAASLLMRELDFKNLRLAEVISYIIAFVLLGIPLAYIGLGVWSLVIAQLSQSLLFSTFTYFQVRHPVKPLFLFLPGLFSFGSKAMGTNIFNWAIYNMDNAFVGRFFGATSLGLYNRAYSLMTAPMNNFITVLQGVLFPAYSRTREEAGTLKRVYLASVGAISLISLPVFGSIAVIPQTVIKGLYGPLWLGAIPLLIPLALAMPFHAMMALAGPLIWGKGKVGRELIIQSAMTILLLLVLAATSRVSLVVLAWGVFGIYMLRFFLMTWTVLRVVGASWLSLFLSIRGGLILGVWSSSLVWGVEKALLAFNVPVVARLAIDVLATGVGTMGITLILPGLLFSTETVWLIGRFSGSLPVAIRSFIRVLGLEWR